MKKQYITPTANVIGIHVAQKMLTISQNSYFDNQGFIRYVPYLVIAEDAD